MTDGAQTAISVEDHESLKQAYESLKLMFDNFRTMSELVESAYLSLREDIKKVNLELERKNAELLQAKTMAELGEMSAVVAHEIRNPLGAMGTSVELLSRDLKDLDPEDPRRKRLDRINNGLAKLNKIVSNLLVYTRPIATEFRSARLGALLEEIVDFTEIEIARLGRDIAVEKDFADGSEKLCVKADPEKINQAIINLCLNAVQAMEDGGTLRVALDKRRAGGNDYAAFTITDTGTGIDSEHIDKIFKPFFTTKQDGTGLGLAIVKKIIESHGGIIEIESELGAGTSVSCYLPCSESQ